MSDIEPTAIVSPNAELGDDVTIGPYAIVETDVVLGDGCIVEAHGIVRKGSILDSGVRVDSFAVLGGDPQDLSFDPRIESGVKIGEGVEIREGVTVHRSSQENGYTEVGPGCFLMGNSHIAHDCMVGAGCVLANGALLGGHVQMGDDVFVGGGAGIHQFLRVGEGVMIGGNAAVSRDVPPRVILAERNLVCGLNLVGLRRLKISSDTIADLKRCYAAVYQELTNPAKLAAAASAIGLGHSDEARSFLEFFQKSGRKFCRPKG